VETFRAYVAARRPAGVKAVLVWIVLVVLGLGSTLYSLRHDDFDGLNNFLQIPFALPWMLIPIGTSDHVRNAWIVAGFGLLNGGLLFHFWPRLHPPIGPGVVWLQARFDHDGNLVGYAGYWESGHEPPVFLEDASLHATASSAITWAKERSPNVLIRPPGHRDHLWAGDGEPWPGRRTWTGGNDL
jgi:hypothetical protein